MATTDRTGATALADALAGRLRAATFAHLLVRADGESLAAAGLLAAACATTERPYQVSVVRTRADVEARLAAVDEATTTVAIGVAGLDAVDGDGVSPGASNDAPGSSGPGAHPSVTAFEAADALGADPDPALALAGVVAGGATPEDAAPGVVERTDFERRPGVVAPTEDPADALAHTTLAHAPYSGDLEAAEETVAALGDADDRAGVDRRVASVLAIDAVSDEAATERAADAIGRAIHPLSGGPLVTVGGYADVLAALAATTPGRGVALALGADPASSLDAWRAHARSTHEGVRSAETARHDGLLVAHTDGPVEAVARLLRDFRSPEPAVLAVGDGEAALATVEDAGEEATDAGHPTDRIVTAAEAVDGSGLARIEGGYARFDPARASEFVDAVRGAT